MMVTFKRSDKMKISILILLMIISVISAIAYLGSNKIREIAIYLTGFFISILLAILIGGLFY